MHICIFAAPRRSFLLILLGLVTELLGCKIKERGSVLEPRWLHPITCKSDLLPAFQRTNLLLAYIMCPSASIDSLCSGQQDKIQNRTINLVAMVPVIRSAPHCNHRFAACFGCIICKLSCNLDDMGFFHACNRFLPCWCVRLHIIIITRIIAW
ncbi:hypothetical protein D1872_217780 [compost metagenome]